MHLFQFYKCFLSERELWYVFALVPRGMYTQIDVSHFWRTKFTFTRRNVVHNRYTTEHTQYQYKMKQKTMIKWVVCRLYTAHTNKKVWKLSVFLFYARKNATIMNDSLYSAFSAISLLLCSHVKNIVFFLQKGKLMVFFVVTFFLCSFKKSEEFLVNLDIKRKEWNSTVF